MQQKHDQVAEKLGKMRIVTPEVNFKTAAAAKAALQMFQGPGNEERRRAEEAAKANARRLMNAPLPKAGADAQSRPNEEPRNEMPRLEKPHAPVAKAETFDGRPSPNMSGRKKLEAM
eukprot:g9758.t3